MNPYVNKVVVNDTPVIDLTGDTVTAADVKVGKTFHLPSGAEGTGTYTPNLQSKEAMAQFGYGLIVTPDEGYDGLSDVTVYTTGDEEKDYRLTPRGTEYIRIAPDDGYSCLSAVNLYVNGEYASLSLHQDTVTISGKEYIALTAQADSNGMVHMGQTGIDTALIEKSDRLVTPSDVEQTITPEGGAEAVKKVKVAAVPTEDKTITTNGTHTPTSGKYWNEVTVNVPTGTARTGADLTVSGNTVNVPAGLYAENASASVGTASHPAPTVSVNSTGLITASHTQSTGYVTGGTTTATSQLSTQAAKTVTPSSSAQTAVESGKYTTGAVTVAAVPTETKTATSNGTVTPSSGKYLSAVTVNVPNVPEYNIVVTTRAGLTVTATKGSTTVSAVSTGTATLTVRESGVWTVSNGFSSMNVTVSDTYPITLSAVDVYGVCWNYNASSTALTRLTESTDPNGYVNTNITTSPSPAVGTGSGSSPFDTLMPWAGMEEYNIVNNAVGAKRGQSGFSRTSNDTVVYIPEYYYKIVDDATNKKRYFYVANAATTGFTKHPGSGKYVGKYNTISGYYSKSGSAPLVNITRAQARTGSTGKGSKWCQYDYASWCAVWLLYLVEFADWNSQTKIGRGVVDASAAVKSGGTDTMTYHTGRASGTDGKVSVQYRGIENPWGNVYDWIDGINFNNRKAYVCTDKSKYADGTSTGYTDSGITLPSSNGYIKTLGMSSAVDWSFLPNAQGGSETTYIPDRVYSNTSWRALYVGGSWDDGGYAGLFFFAASYAASESNAYLGARLLFNP